MMIRVGTEYLDFNDDVEVEKQIKLFEDIDATDGDFSYQFDLPKTNTNVRVLMPFPDLSTKPVYHKIQCELVADNGLVVFTGYLRIERITNVFEVSFFSGNNNWFGLLSAPLSDLDFSDLDVDQTISNLLVYASNDSGIVFPMVDNGGLVTRGYRHMKVEDFVAGIYVKTIFKRIFAYHSIKIQGELLSDPIYNQSIVMRNGKSQEQIDANSTYAEKNTTTARPGENVQYKTTFQNDTTYPYYDGDNDPFDLANSRYTAPVGMRVKIEAAFVPSIVDASYSQRIYMYINGAYPGFVDIGLDAGGLYNSATPGDKDEFVMNRIITMDAGDTLELYTEWQQSGGSTQNDVLRGWIKITPLFIFKAFGNSVVPNWTQREFVANILRPFNVLTHFEPVTKTLTFNFFDKIKAKTAVDLSEHVSMTDVDYSEFISNYGKRNLLSYQEVNFDDMRDYNIQNFFKYSQGSIDADNEFLDDSADVVDSDFSNPLSYINPVFDMSMERTNLIEMVEDESTDITSASSTLNPWARFVVVDGIFLDGDVVRISESTNPLYNGDWIIDSLMGETSPGAADGWVELYGLPFDTTATARITKLTHQYNESDDVYFMINIPFYLVTKFSGHANIRWESFDRTEVPVGFFNLLNTGRTINTDFKQSLSFGEIADPLFYQRTLIESYWHLFGRVVNDPVKIFCTAHLPYNIFLSLDFLHPVTIRTMETTNMYYLNRISGYESSQRECILELIKLP